MKTFASALAAITLFTPFLSYAETWCVGKVRNLAVSRNGVLLVGGPGGLPDTYLCNLHTKANNVEVEACKSMYGQLLSAQAQKKSVRITFNPDIEACNQAPSWGWAENVNWVIVTEQ